MHNKHKHIYAVHHCASLQLAKTLVEAFHTTSENANASCKKKTKYMAQAIPAFNDACHATSENANASCKKKDKYVAHAIPAFDDAYHTTSENANTSCKKREKTWHKPSQRSMMHTTQLARMQIRAARREEKRGTSHPSVQ